MSKKAHNSVLHERMYCMQPQLMPTVRMNHSAQTAMSLLESKMKSKQIKLIGTAQCNAMRESDFSWCIAARRAQESEAQMSLSQTPCSGSHKADTTTKTNLVEQGLTCRHVMKADEQVWLGPAASAVWLCLGSEQGLHQSSCQSRPASSPASALGWEKTHWVSCCLRIAAYNVKHLSRSSTKFKPLLLVGWGGVEWGREGLSSGHGCRLHQPVMAR